MMRRSALLLCLWLLPLLVTAAPRAWLDRDRIEFGETVTLNVETDARGGNEPDFSALDAKFWRIGTSSSTQLSIVNGRQSARTIWAVALEPREQGVIGIPALAVGNELTQPLTLTVLPASASSRGDAEVFVEVEASPGTPYVQQEVRYTLRLYYAVTLLEGQLEDPRADGALVRRLGQDVNYYRTLGGRRYQVAERRYAIVPETSGELVIPGPRFTGRALRSGNFGSLLGNNARLSARGDEVRLTVQPRPPGAPEPWLPATSLSLDDESGALDEVTVGEPITLTLRLHAQGLAAEQLPELKLPEIDGAQVYPDQETTQTRGDGEGVHGERVRKFAIVPTRAGNLTLPEIGIDWWDVQRDAAARATLAARTLRVAPGSGGLAPAPLVDATGAAAAQPVASDADEVATGTAARPWQFAALAFAVLWLLTLVALARRRRAAPTASSARRLPEPADTRGAWRAIASARDASDAARRVIAAARSAHPSAHNLDEVRARLDDEAQRDALQQLEYALYRGAPAQAAIEQVARAFRDGPRWRRPTAAARDEGELPPLYPDRR